ncbi:MAG: GTPase Era [Verrucomicrobia bacterium A1]|nr:MAG: GTPase Era [Verrucomicrobia bacterium A1]
MQSEIGNPQSEIRCGIIAIVGRANVGKSTLLNRILDEKVSIVSPVAQTTRNLIRGILTEPRGQLVFLDTPGVHKAAYDLGRLMNQIARTSIEGADVVLLVLDASHPPYEEDEGWVRRLVHEETPCVALLNKSDAGAKYAQAYRDLWANTAREKSATKSATWLTASGLTGQGVSELADELFRAVPVSPLLFPDNILTDYPRKLNIADIVREKFFAVLRDELPHALAVEIETIDEKESGWTATGTVFVQKNSQKGIVLGNKGRLLKSVREAAGKELSEMYGHPVSLELWVKADKNWSKNFWTLKRLGYAP